MCSFNSPSKYIIWANDGKVTIFCFKSKSFVVISLYTIYMVDGYAVFVLLIYHTGGIVYLVKTP